MAVVRQELFNTVHSAGDKIRLPMKGGLTLDMIWCPPGTFLMGTPEGSRIRDSLLDVDGPYLRQITKGFWIAQTLVTEALWQAFMERKSSLYYRDQPPPSNYPACDVGWDAARAFCSRVTRFLHAQGMLQGDERIDLPTEAQWEYACRAGTTSLWYFGDNPDELGEHAWYSPNSAGEIHPVGLKKPNSWGLYDLYGNVQECCLDGIGTILAKRDKALMVDPLLYPEHNAKIVRGGDYITAWEGLVRSAGRSSVPLWNDEYDQMYAGGIRAVCISAPPPGLPDVMTLE